VGDTARWVDRMGGGGKGRSISRSSSTLFFCSLVIVQRGLSEAEDPVFLFCLQERAARPFGLLLLCCVFPVVPYPFGMKDGRKTRGDGSDKWGVPSWPMHGNGCHTRY